MADPGMGRGRGLALLQALRKSQMSESPPSTENPSPEATPGPSQTPTVVSGTSGSVSSLGGRGRVSQMMSRMALQKPGGPTIGPASDVSPSLPPPGPPRGAGRGIKILQTLMQSQAQSQAKPVAAPTSTLQSEVSGVTQQLTETSISKATSIGKNKFFREVKETPPVVKKGESGTPCQVTANFIYLNFEESNVFEYEVKFEPDQDYKSLRFKLLNEHRHLFQEKTFDGTTLYIPHQLPDDVTELYSTNPNDDSKVKVTLLFRRTRRLSEMVHIYNVLFKQIMKDLELVRFGRQHFNEHAAITIPQHKLEVWPGYVTAVDEYEGGLMLTLDSTHRVLRTQSVLTVIQEAIQANGASWKAAVTETLVGCSVMTTYNKKLFRVDIVDDTMSPRSTFERMEGGQKVKVSFIDYYKKNYGIDIMDFDQPMLISKDTKRTPGSEKTTDFLICLVPELCQMTGLSDKQRSDFRLMKDVATYTRITPNQRHAAFKQYIKNVLANEKAKQRLAGWGLSLAPETIDITARTLPPETLYFGGGAKVSKANAEWNNEATRNPVMQAVDIMKWVILYTKRDQNVVGEFRDTLLRCSGPMGIKVQPPELCLLPTDRTEAYVQGLKRCITGQLQLVVCICPTSRDDRYSAIKKICCADNPVPSQVINARTIMNQSKLRAITQKILLQINCKLGGTLWNISIPFKTTMVIGIDSYHDARRKQRSVCAFVASYNQSMTQWYSRAEFQERGQEVVDGLKAGLIESLKHYLRTNGRLPDRIVIFRDGVGDGQLKTVQKFEIPQMRICFKVVDDMYQPTLTYIIVQKRINTRIFLKADRGFENPSPGTVVDHKITRRDWYDFLIASQKVNQGTVTPTHYVVLHDDSSMTPDHVQRLTYKMCHLYYNWPGTVRVPAPCQYAHKLAYLLGENMHAPHSEILADKLFFL